MLNDLKKAQVFETGEQIAQVEQRLEEINKQIERMKLQSSAVKQDMIKLHQGSTGSNADSVWDWTNNYKQWSEWDKLSSLQEQQVAEEQRIQS